MRMIELIRTIKNKWAWRKIMNEEEIYTVSSSTMDSLKDGGEIDAYTALKLVQGDPKTIKKWRADHPVSSSSNKEE